MSRRRRGHLRRLTAADRAARRRHWEDTGRNPQPPPKPSERTAILVAAVTARLEQAVRERDDRKNGLARGLHAARVRHLRRVLAKLGYPS